MDAIRGIYMGVLGALLILAGCFGGGVIDDTGGQDSGDTGTDDTGTDDTGTDDTGTDDTGTGGGTGSTTVINNYGPTSSDALMIPAGQSGTVNSSAGEFLVIDAVWYLAAGEPAVPAVPPAEGYWNTTSGEWEDENSSYVPPTNGTPAIPAIPGTWVLRTDYVRISSVDCYSFAGTDVVDIYFGIPLPSDGMSCQYTFIADGTYTSGGISIIMGGNATVYGPFYHNIIYHFE